MILLAFLTAMFAPPSEPRDALVGSWTYQDLQADASTPLARTACDTDFGATYHADGTFTGYEEAGRWRVDGEWLRETVTETWEMGGSDETTKIAAAKSARIKLDWKSADVVNLRGDAANDGYALVRCTPYGGE